MEPFMELAEFEPSRCRSEQALRRYDSASGRWSVTGQRRVVSTNPYEALFARHRSAAVPSLWPWQTEVLAAYAGLDGDAAVELPTGTGKTLVGLLAGEHFRDAEGAPVAFLAGNKQLAQQVERQARDLGFPVVRFQGPKDGWASRDVRAFNYGEAIGVIVQRGSTSNAWRSGVATHLHSAPPTTTWARNRTPTTAAAA
jgi:Rad3-related DNA helicase